MKKELIKTPEYLLVVDDSEIKVGDWVIETRNGLNELHFTNSRYVINKHIQKKVIAHLPLNNSPILEGVPLLPIFDEGVFVTPSHFEFEMEKQFEYRETTNNSITGFTSLPYPTNEVKPRTTTNSQGQTQLVGRYIFN